MEDEYEMARSFVHETEIYETVCCRTVWRPTRVAFGVFFFANLDAIGEIKNRQNNVWRYSHAECDRNWRKKLKLIKVGAAAFKNGNSSGSGVIFSAKRVIRLGET
jgi:hypothetical protein